MAIETRRTNADALRRPMAPRVDVDVAVSVEAVVTAVAPPAAATDDGDGGRSCRLCKPPAPSNIRRRHAVAFEPRRAGVSRRRRRDKRNLLNVGKVATLAVS
uniref:Uncharacterized protein n=1 Tax=Haemonchus contortus TaxID=6289 RepID=A0A7I5E9M6_HAECO